MAETYASSITANWTTVSGAAGYEVDASTAANFTGTIFSSITSNGQSTSLSPQSLSANTTLSPSRRAV